jgi:HEAT repeat protein
VHALAGDAEENIRKQVAELLGDIGDRGALGPLILPASVMERADSVRKAAGEALLRSGHAEVGRVVP